MAIPALLLSLAFPTASARSTRHASENLNFREAVVRYQGLCYDNMKKLKPMPGAGAGAGARAASAKTLLTAVSSSTAPADVGLKNSSEGGTRGTAPERGGDADSAAASCASSSSPCDVDVTAAAAAARAIVNRFVEEGAPEQVRKKEHGFVDLAGRIIGRSSAE